eukprot:CAMPEP_0194038020 /NCGR_PEP_ID=MMETSP0009_2-20130614/10291_1 /TAXON_ID=210454 /ORGANISM="Grammatophora oceanica, Strain CCMP 410" /LENGTH=459 /DNA_ID=CAMNT_0038680377 /DNA_START=18 /DNA_END=1398 /DNA_ORIENTATION=-
MQNFLYLENETWLELGSMKVCFGPRDGSLMRKKWNEQLDIATPVDHYWSPTDSVCLFYLDDFFEAMAKPGATVAQALAPLRDPNHPCYAEMNLTDDEEKRAWYDNHLRQYREYGLSKHWDFDDKYTWLHRQKPDGSWDKNVLVAALGGGPQRVLCPKSRVIFLWEFTLRDKARAFLDSHPGQFTADAQGGYKFIRMFQKEQFGDSVAFVERPDPGCGAFHENGFPRATRATAAPDPPVDPGPPPPPILASPPAPAPPVILASDPAPAPPTDTAPLPPPILASDPAPAPAAAAVPGPAPPATPAKSGGAPTAGFSTPAPTVAPATEGKTNKCDILKMMLQAQERAFKSQLVDTNAMKQSNQRMGDHSQRMGDQSASQHRVYERNAHFRELDAQMRLDMYRDNFRFLSPEKDASGNPVSPVPKRAAQQPEAGQEAGEPSVGSPWKTVKLDSELSWDVDDDV